MSGQYRPEALRVPCTPAEAAEIRRRAEAAGLGVGPWLRRLALGDAEAPDGRQAGERWRRQPAEEEL